MDKIHISRVRFSNELSNIDGYVVFNGYDADFTFRRGLSDKVVAQGMKELLHRLEIGKPVTHIWTHTTDTA